MIGLKTARAGTLVSLMILLTACGTKFKALTLDAAAASHAPSVGLVATPPPMPGGDAVLTDFPSAFNTGVPSGVSLKASGAVTISTPGTVIDALDIKGVVHIKANNVTLKRSKVTIANYVQVIIDEGLTGVVVEDCEISGVGTANDGAMGIQGPGKFLRNNIHHVQSGIVPNSGALIQDNYIHDFQASGTPSYNGVQLEGGIDNVLIYHNSIINSATQTSAVMINNFYGHVANVSVRANLLGGGEHTVVCDGQFSASALTSISFTSNTLRTGSLGYKLFNQCAPEFSSNDDDTTGKPVN